MSRSVAGHDRRGDCDHRGGLPGARVGH